MTARFADVLEISLAMSVVLAERLYPPGGRGGVPGV